MTSHSKQWTSLPQQATPDRHIFLLEGAQHAVA